MREQIFSLAQTLSGAGDEEQVALEALCIGAESYWKERLRAPLDRCLQSFICAAAFLAAASLNELRCGDVKSFPLGMSPFSYRPAREMLVMASGGLLKI